MNRMNDRTLPSCANLRAVFQHPLLEGDSTAATPDDQQLERTLQARARAACSTCPLFEQCLENAILDHDVAGFAAGTTPRQRSRIRSYLASGCVLTIGSLSPESSVAAIKLPLRTS